LGVFRAGDDGVFGWGPRPGPVPSSPSSLKATRPAQARTPRFDDSTDATISNCVAVAFGGTVDKTNRSLMRRKGVAEPTTPMNTKKKQPKKPQSQPRKFRDLQSKKNPKGGVGVAGSRNAQRKETPTLPPAI
jgi:hypothetical protein